MALNRALFSKHHIKTRRGIFRRRSIKLIRNGCCFAQALTAPPAPDGPPEFESSPSGPPLRWCTFKGTENEGGPLVFSLFNSACALRIATSKAARNAPVEVCRPDAAEITFSQSLISGTLCTAKFVKEATSPSYCATKFYSVLSVVSASVICVSKDFKYATFFAWSQMAYCLVDQNSDSVHFVLHYLS